MLEPSFRKLVANCITTLLVKNEGMPFLVPVVQFRYLIFRSSVTVSYVPIEETPYRKPM